MHILYTECVSKIRINFNLNFPLYYLSARGDCWRRGKPDSSSKQSYSQNDRDVETKCGVLVIEEPRKLSHWALSNGNNRFFGYPRAIVYDVVAKYTTVQRSMPARKSHSKERNARTPLKELSADGPAQLLRKLASIVGVSEPNASNCQGGPSIQITT